MGMAITQAAKAKSAPTTPILIADIADAKTRAVADIFFVGRAVAEKQVRTEEEGSRQRCIAAVVFCVHNHREAGFKASTFKVEKLKIKA